MVTVQSLLVNIVGRIDSSFCLWLLREPLVVLRDQFDLLPVRSRTFSMFTSLLTSMPVLLIKVIILFAFLLLLYCSRAVIPSVVSIDQLTICLFLMLSPLSTSVTSVLFFKIMINSTRKKQNNNKVNKNV